MMENSLKEQLRLLEKLFDAKLDPISRDLTTIKGEVAGSHARITVLEKDVTKLKVRSKNNQVRAELRVKRWHVWAMIIAAGIAATAAVVAAAL